MIKFYRDKKCDAFIYSKIGQNHIKEEGENQDSIAFEMLDDNVWFIAIADGVSTAAFAKKGSKAAVESVKVCAEKIHSGELKETDPDAIKVEIVKEWKSRFTSEWDKYATTLNFTICINSRLIVGLIGDGLIVLNTDGKTRILTDNEDFYSTETYALGTTVRRSTFDVEIIEYKRKIAIYMASDGIGKEVTEEGRAELGHYIENMMKKDDDSIEDEIDAWVTGLGRKNGDDKSIGFVRWEE